MTVAAVENLLKESRSAIIDLLKINGGMNVEQLAQELEVTKVCIRRHLSLLESDGLIKYVEERHERGRPRFIYSLTEKARCLFPQTYDEFAEEILVQLQRRYGEAGLEVVLKGRADELIEQLKVELDGLNFDERVKSLAKTMSAKGYLADARRLKDGTYRLRQRNCPTESVAVAFPQVCDEEVRVYRELLGCQVTRECRIADGAPACEFRISLPALTQISGKSNEKGKVIQEKL
ncbi:MAG: DeoR family transcriptional regulator [Acidobacteria bacterium]|nr:DeoR family transcriptional regulator [Acidobacteriota bacterium]